jgi:hypothetical protein
VRLRTIESRRDPLFAVTRNCFRPVVTLSARAEIECEAVHTFRILLVQGSARSTALHPSPDDAPPPGSGRAACVPVESDGAGCLVGPVGAVSAVDLPVECGAVVTPGSKVLKYLDEFEASQVAC